MLPGSKLFPVEEIIPLVFGFSLKTISHVRANKHPGTCSFVLCINKYWKNPHYFDVQTWKNKLKCTFNVLIHQVTPLKMSWDSIMTAFQSFQSLYSVSRLCSQSRRCGWYGREAIALFSPKGRVWGLQAEAAFLFSQVFLLQQMRHPVCFFCLIALNGLQ